MPCFEHMKRRCTHSAADCKFSHSDNIINEWKKANPNHPVIAQAKEAAQKATAAAQEKKTKADKEKAAAAEKAKAKAAAADKPKYQKTAAPAGETRQCHFHPKGTCNKGKNCNFLLGEKNGTQAAAKAESSGKRAKAKARKKASAAPAATDQSEEC